MSPGPISRSPDLKRLRDEGYHVEVHGGYLLIRDVPYVNADRQVCTGILVSTLQLHGDVTGPPDTHVALFVGDQPCHADGSVIEGIRHGTTAEAVAPGVTTTRSFSSKPPGGYPDYYEKMATYANILSSPAQAMDPSATAKTFPVVPPEDPESVFQYLDTASSRAGIATASARLEGHVLAVVGLGGTGAYVFDLLAKVPAAEIHAFDGNVFSQHNAFRSPGAASIEDLRARPNKAEYLASIYSKMHRHITPHPYHVDAANVDELLQADFVFLCIDDGEAKTPIIERLRAAGKPFIDVGMGIELVDDRLTGILRVTTATSAQHDHVAGRISMAAGPANEYDSNIQVADLNALNAALAVIKWKKLCGFYADLEQEHHSLYSVDGNHLLNEAPA